MAKYSTRLHWTKIDMQISSYVDPTCASIVHDGPYPNKNFRLPGIKADNGYRSSHRSAAYQLQNFEDALALCKNRSMADMCRVKIQ